MLTWPYCSLALCDGVKTPRTPRTSTFSALFSNLNSLRGLHQEMERSESPGGEWGNGCCSEYEREGELLREAAEVWGTLKLVLPLLHGALEWKQDIRRK